MSENKDALQELAETIESMPPHENEILLMEI
jgi:hypothetical protein